jgi:hypothetical protein
MKCKQCGHWEEKLNIEQVSPIHEMARSTKKYWIEQRDTYKKEIFYCRKQHLVINRNGIINFKEINCVYFIHKLEYYMREIIRKDGGKR